MPTAAKLIAALCLGMLGFSVAEMIKTNMPAGTNFGHFTLVCTVIGFLSGWLVIGSRSGRGQAAAISNGFTGMVTMVGWSLFILSSNEMLAKSLERKYRTAADALLGIFDIFIEFGEQLLDVRIILVLLCGAIASGVLAEVASRHWR